MDGSSGLRRKCPVSFCPTLIQFSEHCWRDSLSATHRSAAGPRGGQLKAELAELQRLNAEEEQLRFDIFKARLAAAEQERLEQEAKARIDRRSPVSAELQLEVARDEILREWFAAESEPAAE